MKNAIKASALLLALSLMSFTTDQFTSAKHDPEFSTYSKPVIKWKSTEIDLGEITQNKPVIIEFEFSNTGESPVIISSVQASCGCTSTDFVKTPILPGESTKIKAVFNAAAKGKFSKQVTVVTSAEEIPKTLVFTGIVI